jgi:uncharacterized membrane protein YoaK (UPF0700 family)
MISPTKVPLPKAPKIPKAPKLRGGEIVAPDGTKFKMRRQGSEQISPVAQVPLHERRKSHFAAICIGGVLLTLNAGFINAVTLHRSGVVVAHVTGTFTKSAIAISDGDGLEFVKMWWMILCFMFGSFVTSLMVPYQTFYLGRAYNRVFIVGTIFLSIAAFVGIYSPTDDLYCYFTTIACGMQNAMTTGYSGSVLRTTHMTGMTTDVGIILGKIAKGNWKDAWKLGLFVPMMLGFVIGGILGTEASRSQAEYALLINVGLYGGTGLLYSFYLAVDLNIPFFKALLHSEDLPAPDGEVVPTEYNVDEDVVLPHVERDHEVNTDDGEDDDVS